MLGKCPGCNRSYDISDDFLNMGGKAKCPHCLEELEFEGQASARLDPREDQTRIDPNRERAATRVDPDEVDARCASCDRRFKIDSQYLRMGGQAKCPHCGDELMFDVPQQPPPPKPPEEEDLWGDETGQTVEIGSQRIGAEDEPPGDVWEDDRFGSGADERDPGAPDDDPGVEDGVDEDDPYSGTGEVSLPELEGLQSDVPPDETWDVVDEEFGPGDLDDSGEFDEDALPTEVMSSPFAGGGEELGDDMPTPDEDGAEDLAEGGQEDPYGVGELGDPDPDQAADQQDWDLSAAGEEPFGSEDLADESAGGLATALDEELEQADPDLGGESLDGLADALGDALAAEADPIDEPAGAQAPAPQVEGLDEDEPEDDSTKEVSGDWAAELDAQAAARDTDQQAPEPPVGDAQDAAGPGEPDQPDAPFENLASTDDWASAAAAWAESGFSTDQMPSFIKSEPPPDGEDGQAAELRAEDLPKVGEDGPVYRTTPSGQNLDAMRVSSLPADAPADSVEVSDADIIMLDDGEVEVLDDEPGPAPKAADETENWAQRANREVAARPTASPAAAGTRLPAFLSRLNSPPVLAAVLGVLALVIISLMWVLLGSGEEVDSVAFPSEGIEAERIDAPAPRAYKAKDSAVKHYGLGNRQAYLGQFEQAILEYQKASRLDPGYPHPHRAMGAIYAALGKRRLSVTAYRLYLQLAPEGPDAAQVRAILER